MLPPPARTVGLGHHRHHRPQRQAGPQRGHGELRRPEEDEPRRPSSRVLLGAVEPGALLRRQRVQGVPAVGLPVASPASSADSSSCSRRRTASTAAWKSANSSRSSSWFRSGRQRGYRPSARCWNWPRSTRTGPAMRWVTRRATRARASRHQEGHEEGEDEHGGLGALQQRLRLRPQRLTRLVNRQPHRPPEGRTHAGPAGCQPRDVLELEAAVHQDLAAGVGLVAHGRQHRTLLSLAGHCSH